MGNEWPGRLVPRSSDVERRRPTPMESDGDGDEEDFASGSGGSDSDFVPLRGGWEYVRKFEIVGVRWENFRVSCPRHSMPYDSCLDCTPTTRLNVFFSDIPSMYLYGDEARAVMRSLGLPEEPPRS